MVVPEAHLVNEEKYHQVYVVTSQSPSCPSQQIEDFFSTRESVQLFFHRVEGFNNLEKDEEHQNFSEALLRVYLEAREASTDGCLDVCLTGGFKTMSASLQRAARLLGADSLFHVLCDDNPIDDDELKQAIQKEPFEKSPWEMNPAIAFSTPLAPRITQQPGPSFRETNIHSPSLPHPFFVMKLKNGKQSFADGETLIPFTTNSPSVVWAFFLMNGSIGWNTDPIADDGWVRSLR